MIDDKLRNTTKRMIEDEYQRIISKYSLSYNSLHEGYAVLLEEVEEAEREFGIIKSELNLLWNKVKNDDVPLERTKLDIKCIQEASERGICELVQVSAVCKRFLNY